MWPTQGPITIPTLKSTISAGEITQISHGAKTIMVTQGQTIPTTFNLTIINTIFPTNTVFPAKLHNLYSKVLWLTEN